MKDASGKKRHVVAFTPIKLRNVRLPGKNVADLCGRPLLNYAIEAVDALDIENYVYCSNRKVADFIDSPNAKLLLRSPLLDQDVVQCIDIAREFCQTVIADIYLMYHVTSPLLPTDHYRALLNALEHGADSAMTTCCLCRPASFRHIPLNWAVDLWPRFQDLDPITTFPVGGRAFTRTLLLSGRLSSSNRAQCHVSPKDAVDIDTQIDLDLARLLMERRNVG